MCEAPATNGDSSDSDRLHDRDARLLLLIEPVIPQAHWPQMEKILDLTWPYPVLRAGASIMVACK